MPASLYFPKARPLHPIQSPVRRPVPQTAWRKRTRRDSAGETALQMRLHFPVVSDKKEFRRLLYAMYCCACKPSFWAKIIFFSKKIRF